MARRIVITSGKGGVGKTTFTVNLGNSLARKGIKTCLIDLDIGLNNLDVAANLDKKVVYDIVDVALGKCRVMQALVQDYNNPNLYILPSSQSFARHAVTTEKLLEIVSVLNEAFEYILIDCPAGIDDGFYKAVKCANEAIIVTTPHVFAIRDADKVFRILLSLGMNSSSLVVNRARGDLIAGGEMISVAAVSSFIKCPLLGVVPESDEISVNPFSAIMPSGSEVFFAYNILAKNLLSGEIEIYDVARRFRGVFGAIKRRMKKI